MAGGLFALNVALNIPLFEAGEGPYRGSIEAGYASMARFFAEHPNPWGWNPLQYCGMPAQFTYVPALPYLAAIGSRLTRSIDVDHVYRILASGFACLGPASLFLFALYFIRNRWWALAVALVYSLFSPIYYLVHTIDIDRGVAYLPWRLQVLAKYGEGPHNAGLTLLPLGIAALWSAATGRGFRRLLLAAVLLAAIALTNWVATLALAICCALLLLTLAGSGPVTGFRLTRALAAAALGYGLACFWLTPSFIGTIAFNWPEDAFHYRMTATHALLLGGLPLTITAARITLARLFPGRYYLWFVTLCFVAFAWIVLWFYWGGVDTIPESRRYALEMEMFLILASFEWFRVALSAPIVPLRYFAIYAALTLFLFGWGQLRSYLLQGFGARRPSPKENSIEYRVAKRLSELQPQGRVFASGGLRFRLNSWFDLQQVGGGFESGLTNRLPVRLAYQIREGEDPVRELEALGAEFVVVHGRKSREYYRDFKNPAQFEGVLEPVWRDEDDTIYRAPFESLAGSLSAKWAGASDLWLEGPVAQSEAVQVKVNYDSGWRAEQGGQPLRIERDASGFLLLHPAAGPDERIHLRYHGTAEQHVFGALSLATWMAGIAGFAFSRHGKFIV